MAYIDDIYAVVQIAPTGVPTYVRLSQNENGRKMYFAIVGGTIPSSSTAAISGTKPDGVVYSASGTITGNTITINENVQMTAAAGQWDAKLKIINSGQTIATGRIRFVIDADPVAPGSVPSDSQLEGLVAEAEQYAEAARNAAYYGSPLTASTVAGMTDHNRVYVYTGSESGYTAGNWYYWNGSAWTSGGVYNAVAVSTDPSLTIAGKAADSKAAGDRLTAAENDISDVKSDLSDIEDEIAAIVPGLSEEAKEALLACFAHVAWTVDDGIEYYNDLASALDVEPPAPSFNYGEYTPETLVDGQYIDLDGTIKTGSQHHSFYIADFIPVVRSSYWIGMSPATIVFDNSSAFHSESNWRVSEYDKDQNFIKQTQYSNSTAYSSRIIIFDNNTKYIRLGWYDPYSSSEKIFEIENPTNIIEFPMVSGDYSASTGEPITQASRIRSTDAIECSETLTLEGSPFDNVWGSSNYGWNYMIRCYGVNDGYIGYLPVNRGNLYNEPLLENTAKIKVVMQHYGVTNPSDRSGFAMWSNRLMKINGQSYYIVKGT